MDEIAVADPQQVQDPAQQQVVAPVDPFTLEENALASLSPEQRASLDPIIDSWKKRANEEITKRESTAVEKYKPLEEKAQALDKLTNYAPFVQWWQAQQRSAQSNAQTTGQQQQIQSAQPQDFATQQEWQEAVWEASQGNGQKLQQIQAKMTAAWVSPIFQQMNTRQKSLETQLEVRDLFETFPDAKELDKIGIDPKTKAGVSLLEMGLDWAERNGKPLEDGYKLAKQWSDSLKVGAQQVAMGMVNAKRGDVTAGPSTSSATQTVIEVDNADDLIKKSLEAQISGNKDARFVIKSR